MQHAILDCQIAPADHPVAPQQRQSIVSALAFCHRSVGFEAIHPSPEQLEAPAIPNHGIKRSQKPHTLRLLASRWILIGRPVPVNAFNSFVRQAFLRPLQRRRDLGLPLRRSEAKPPNEKRQPLARKRRVDANGNIDQRIDPPLALGLV